MRRSEEIKQLAIALSKAQAAMKPAIKDRENPFFKNTYADLASVWEAIKIPLTANGFCVSQFLSSIAGHIIVETLLLHESGEWILNELMLPVLKNDPQSYSSSATYGRRISLAAIAGVATEDDDAEGSIYRIEDKKPQAKELPTQTHKEAWKILLEIYGEDTERIKLAINEIIQKNSIISCTEEEAKMIVSRLHKLQVDMEDNTTKEEI